MADEDVTLRFGQTGADELAGSIGKVLSQVAQIEKAFKQLGQQGSPTVAFVQNTTRAFTEMQGAATGTTTPLKAVGESAGVLHGHLRRTSLVVGQLAGTMTSELAPGIGKVAGSFANAAVTAAAVGGAFGLVLGAVHLLTEAVSSYVEKSREAEAFQIRLTRAFKTFDTGNVVGEIDKVVDELATVDGATEKNRQKLKQLQETFAATWKAIEQPKLARETRIGELETIKQQTDAEMERARVAEDASVHLRSLDIDRAKTAKEGTAAVARDAEARTAAGEREAKILEQQIALTRQLAGERAEAEIAGVRQQAAQMRLRGAPGEQAAKDLEAAARARADAARAGGEVQVGAMQFGFSERQRASAQAQAEQARAQEERQAKDALDKGLMLAKDYADRRAMVLEAAHTRETADLEASNRDALSLARDRQATEERYIGLGRDQKLAAIKAEAEALQAFAKQYPNLREVQEQVDRRLIELQRERLGVEVDTNNKIIQQRTAMVAKMKELAQQEAQIGQSLQQAAATRLGARGIKAGTREQTEAEISKMQREAQQTIALYAGGGRVDFSKLLEANQVAAQFAQMVEKGTTAGGAIGQQVAQATAALGGARPLDTSGGIWGQAQPWATGAATPPWKGQAAPTTPGGGVLGMGAFQPGSESLELYQARLELARAREQQGALPVTAGILPPEAETRLGGKMKEVEAAGNAAIQRVINSMPDIFQPLFERFADELVRRLEQDAART